MAPGCETESIANLMKAARPFSYGMCMAGAGRRGVHVCTDQGQGAQTTTDRSATHYRGLYEEGLGGGGLGPEEGGSCMY